MVIYCKDAITKIVIIIQYNNDNNDDNNGNGNNNNSNNSSEAQTGHIDTSLPTPIIPPYYLPFYTFLPITTQHINNLIPDTLGSRLLSPLCLCIPSLWGQFAWSPSFCVCEAARHVFFFFFLLFTTNNY